MARLVGDEVGNEQEETIELQPGRALERRLRLGLRVAPSAVGRDDLLATDDCTMSQRGRSAGHLILPLLGGNCIVPTSNRPLPLSIWCASHALHGIGIRGDRSGLLESVASSLHPFAQTEST